MTLERIVAFVNKQAEDEGLWFEARTAPEAYLQQELRNLHALIELEAAAAEADMDEALCSQCGGIFSDGVTPQPHLVCAECAK